MEYSVYTIDVVGWLRRKIKAYLNEELVFTSTTGSIWSAKRHILKDAEGNEVLKWVRSFRLTGTTYSLLVDNVQIGTVKKGHISKVLEADVQGELVFVTGNFMSTAFTFERGDREIAKVSRKLLRRRRSFGIAIAPGEDHLLCLALLTIVIDIIRRQSSG